MASRQQDVSQGQRSAGAFRNVFVADAKGLDAGQLRKLSQKAVERINYATSIATTGLNKKKFVIDAAKLDVKSEEAKTAAADFMSGFAVCLIYCVRISMSVRYAVLVARACTQLQQVSIGIDIPDVIGPAIGAAVKAYDDLYGRLMHYFTQACIITGDMAALGSRTSELLGSMGDINVSVHQMYESATPIVTNVYRLENAAEICDKIFQLYESSALPNSDPRSNMNDLTTAAWRMSLLAIMSSQVSAYTQRLVSYGAIPVSRGLSRDAGTQAAKTVVKSEASSHVGDFRATLPLRVYDVDEPTVKSVALSRLMDLGAALQLRTYEETGAFNRAFTKLEGEVSRFEAGDGVFDELVEAAEGHFVIAPFPVPN